MKIRVLFLSALFLTTHSIWAMDEAPRPMTIETELMCGLPGDMWLMIIGFIVPGAENIKTFSDDDFQSPAFVVNKIKSIAELTSLKSSCWSFYKLLSSELAPVPALQKAMQDRNKQFSDFVVDPHVTFSVPCNRFVRSEGNYSFKGYTMLDCACSEEWVAVVKIILSAAGDDIQELLMKKNSRKNVVLWHAKDRSHEIIKLLLDAAPDPEALMLAENEYGERFFDSYAYQFPELLVGCNLQKLVMEPDASGYTALHKASLRIQRAPIEDLLEKMKIIFIFAGDKKYELLMLKDDNEKTAYDNVFRFGEKIRDSFQVLSFLKNIQDALEAGDEQRVQELLTIQPQVF